MKQPLSDAFTSVSGEPITVLTVHALALTVSIYHDWLDYFAALGGLIGGVAAVVALILAVQSKQAAARSATAAEATQRLADEQVAIMRHEADVAERERSRRAGPEIQLGARAMLTSETRPPNWVILTVGRPLERERNAPSRPPVGEPTRA